MPGFGAVTRTMRGDSQTGRPAISSLRHVAAARGVEAADLGPGQLVRQHDLAAAARRGQARHREPDLAPFARLGQRGLGAGKARQVLERAPRHRQQLEAARRVERGLRGEPHQLERLGLVGHRLLAGRRRRDEEAGVEALGHAGRREPVAVIVQIAQVQPQPLRGAELGDRQLVRMQAQPPGVQRLGVDGAVGEQQPDFLEAFAQRRHRVGQAAVGERHPRAQHRVVGADADRRRVVVVRVDHAAGEDAGAAAQVAVALGAAQHQHLDAVRAVAQQQHRRRRPRVGRNRVAAAHRATPAATSAAISSAR